MAYVTAEPCIDLKDETCIDVLPVRLSGNSAWPNAGAAAIAGALERWGGSG